MFFQTFAISLLPVLGAIASPYKPQHVIGASEDACPKGIHIVGVRGTMELPGFGAMQEIVDELKKKISGSDDFAITYPASGIAMRPDGTYQYNFFEYTASESQGYGALLTHLEDYYDLCPETKIVIMGYSQGAHVVGDVLCGAQGILFPHKDPLDQVLKENIHAIIQLGDPTNLRKISWHVGNSTNNGLFPRATIKACEDLKDRWQSYCDAEDTFCDAGNSIPVHLGYVERYLDDIVDFIVGKVQTVQNNVWEYRVKNNDL